MRRLTAFSTNFNRFRPHHLALAFAFVAGVFLHFSNLHGAIYLAEDEARSFTLMSSGPLMYLMSHPIYTIFREQSAVFYLAGTLGALSILWLWMFARTLFGGRWAAWAALLYALWPNRINFDRTLQPSVFVEFFFLLALWLSALAATRRRGRLIFWFAAGGSLAFALYTHHFSYALILGIYAAAVPGALLGDAGSRRANFVRSIAALSGGLLTGALLLGLYLYYFQNGYNYAALTLGFGGYTLETITFEKTMFQDLW
ncbi:MAG: glycosyltransferase family 39 protein, partial [Candidatus Omnitrophica bacterium]|nr:glycosyltransferase family 39 protein [Candidatus Omnitrophota bacterium]